MWLRCDGHRSSGLLRALWGLGLRLATKTLAGFRAISTSFHLSWHFFVGFDLVDGQVERDLDQDAIKKVYRTPELLFQDP